MISWIRLVVITEKGRGARTPDNEAMRRVAPIAPIRRLIVTLGVERWRQNRTELARVLHKNPDVLSWWAGEALPFELRTRILQRRWIE